jgi:hypothetical protein
MAHHDEDRAHELVELDLEDRPDGPAAAAAFAAGFGIFVLGLLTVLSEVSVPLHDWLETWDFDQGVGPLAGKTTLAAIAWALSWIVVAALLRKREVNLKLWFVLSLVLGILGAIGTFPPIFLSFAPE